MLTEIRFEIVEPTAHLDSLFTTIHKGSELNDFWNLKRYGRYYMDEHLKFTAMRHYSNARTKVIPIGNSVDVLQEVDDEGILFLKNDRKTDGSSIKVGEIAFIKAQRCPMALQIQRISYWLEDVSMEKIFDIQEEFY